MKQKLILLFLLSVTVISTSYGQLNYIIKFKINGVKGTTCMIAYYYSNGTYLKDTLKVDGLGRCTYKSPADLARGLYVLVITDKIYFDLVINNDHKFSMETSLDDPINKMVIKGSPENDLFYKYLRYNRSMFDQIQELDKKSQIAAQQKDTLRSYADSVAAINKQLIAYKLRIVAEYPDS
ncbi:MAG: DUF4369 domain-containing protein, partial [Bacteroidetes bacterium]|nr:DUF4369 domain-containing protein [Bacteroidota bacterium]